MGAEFLTFDQAGRHNHGGAAEAMRVMESGSWKRQRIALLYPAADLVSPKVMFCQWGLIFPPNNPLHRMLCLGTEVGEAYSNGIANMLGHPDLSQWEYVLTMEHDNTPPADGLLMLLKAMELHPELDAIGGLYWTKGEGGVAQIWGDPRDPVLNFRPQVPRFGPDGMGEVQECNGTGMGFTLFRLSMFKDERIPRPWFRTKASAEEGVGTQDLAFWGEARKLGHRCAIDTHCKVGHYDHATGIVW